MEDTKQITHGNLPSFVEWVHNIFTGRQGQPFKNGHIYLNTVTPMEGDASPSEHVTLLVSGDFNRPSAEGRRKIEHIHVLTIEALATPDGGIKVRVERQDNASLLLFVDLTIAIGERWDVWEWKRLANQHGRYPKQQTSYKEQLLAHETKYEVILEMHKKGLSYAQISQQYTSGKGKGIGAERVEQITEQWRALQKGAALEERIEELEAQLEANISTNQP